MTGKEIESLMSAYGFAFDFADIEQKKTRFQGEETFIDLWQGKKGTTVGIYSKAIHSMKYEYPFQLIDLEKLLIKLTK